MSPDQTYQAAWRREAIKFFATVLKTGDAKHFMFSVETDAPVAAALATMISVNSALKRGEDSSDDGDFDYDREEPKDPFGFR